jgi:Zn-finger nucleic acid-binding protein
MGSPYRERPRFLLCPRCGEVLDRAFEGVSSCLRCEGLWIAPATLDAAFGNPRWPNGNAMWWRNSIECPECTFEGKPTLMAARMSSDVIVDQCAEHGVWLDRGELGRLMGVAADELGALRDRLAATAPDLDQLVARRQKWRADLETRRKAALDYRQALEEEHRRRIEIAEAERKRMEPAARDRSTAATASTQEMPHLARPAAHADPLRAETDSSEVARRAAQRKQELGTQRAQALAEVTRLQDRIVALEDHLRRLDEELSEAKRRVNGIYHELDAAQARLHLIDDQLDAPP